MPDKTLPTHLGIIMDGNRRWAKAQGKDLIVGHERGAKTLKKMSFLAIERGVKYVSAYVFSKENWARTEKEVGFLMKLMVEMPNKYLEEFDKAGIKIVFLGSRNLLNESVLKTIKKTETRTKNNKRATLALCFNYGGHQEIVDAIKKLLAQGVKPHSVTEKSFAKMLYEPELPPIDLIIRTSGEKRLSGFMLWRAAYSELYFFDKYWPDFTEADLDKALKEYAGRQRRFGQ